MKWTLLGVEFAYKGNITTEIGDEHTRKNINNSVASHRNQMFTQDTSHEDDN